VAVSGGVIVVCKICEGRGFWRHSTLNRSPQAREPVFPRVRSERIDVVVLTDSGRLARSRDPAGTQRDSRKAARTFPVTGPERSLQRQGSVSVADQRAAFRTPCDSRREGDQGPHPMTSREYHAMTVCAHRTGRLRRHANLRCVTKYYVGEPRVVAQQILARSLHRGREYVAGLCSRRK
jgi:hypothetical protein